MKSILILNMCNRYDFYGHMVEIIENTWAKPIIDGEYPNIKYYSVGCLKKEDVEKTEHRCKGIIDEECHSIFLPIVDEFVQTFDKYIMMLKTIKSMAAEYDYIMIVNPCVYVHVALLDKFVQNIKDDDHRIFCGRIYAPKYSCGPYEYSYYGGLESLLLSRREYLAITTEAKYRTQARTVDQVKSPVYYKKYKMYSADNAIGFLIDSELAMKRKDFRKYYQDWNMRYFGDMDEEIWNQQITILVREPGHECGYYFAKYLYIHEVISESILDLSLIANYINKGKTTVISIEENEDPNKEGEEIAYDGEEFIKIIDGDKLVPTGRIIKVLVYTDNPTGALPLWSVTTALVDGGFVIGYKEVYEKSGGKQTKPVIPDPDPDDTPYTPDEYPPVDPSTYGTIDFGHLTSTDPNQWSYDGNRNNIPDILEWHYI